MFLGNMEKILLLSRADFYLFPGFYTIGYDCLGHFHPIGLHISFLAVLGCRKSWPEMGQMRSYYNLGLGALLSVHWKVT